MLLVKLRKNPEQGKSLSFLRYFQCSRDLLTIGMNIYTNLGRFWQIKIRIFASQIHKNEGYLTCDFNLVFPQMTQSWQIWHFCV